MCGREESVASPHQHHSEKQAAFFHLEIPMAKHGFRRPLSALWADASAIFNYLDISLSTQASPSPRESPPSGGVGAQRGHGGGRPATRPGSTRSSGLPPGFSWSPGSLVASAQQPGPGPGPGEYKSLREKPGKRSSRVRGPPGKGPRGAHGWSGSCQAPITHNRLPRALHPWETEPREAAGSEEASGHGKLLGKVCQHSLSPPGILCASRAPAAPRSTGMEVGGQMPGWPHSFRPGS